jgi:hypothetical protein
MIFRQLGFAAAIVADQPDAVEQHVRQVGEYLRRFGNFIAHAATEHPNEFVIAVATVWVAIFTMVLAVATIRLWNSTAALAKFAEEQSVDMKASIAAAEAANAHNRTVFEASQRPWLKVNVGINGPFQLHKSEQSGDFAYLGLQVGVTNLSQTPAISIHGHTSGFPGAFQEGRAIEAFNAMCEFDGSPGFGEVLFPNDPTMILNPMPASWHQQNIDISVSRGANPENGLAVFVCVSYRSVVSDIRYQTSFMYL